jgi:hypothetical protein
MDINDVGIKATPAAIFDVLERPLPIRKVNLTPPA